MTQPKHTPGPWVKVHDHPDEVTRASLAYIRAAENPYPDEIAYVFGCYEPEMNANAHLIAAAPDLYEALIEIRDMLWSRPDISDRLRPLMGFAEEATNQKASRAIAKAEGREI